MDGPNPCPSLLMTFNCIAYRPVSHQRLAAAFLVSLVWSNLAPTGDASREPHDSLRVGPRRIRRVEVRDAFRTQTGVLRHQRHRAVLSSRRHFASRTFTHYQHARLRPPPGLSSAPASIIHCKLYIYIYIYIYIGRSDVTECMVRYDRHFVGITWHNMWSQGTKIYRVISMLFNPLVYKKCLHDQ